MISRLPNMRASIENAPGPSPAMATSMVAANTRELRDSKRFGEAAGSSESPTPAAPAPIKAAAIGVRKPATSKLPAAKASRPLNHPVIMESARAK